jgi:hypothetical protein
MARFQSLHCPAIRWPLSRFHFVEGFNPPEDVSPLAVLEANEKRDGWGRWAVDPYGAGEALREKRVGRGYGVGAQRGVWERLGGLDRKGKKGVLGLLAWEGGESVREVFRGYLPWDPVEEEEGEGHGEGDEVDVDGGVDGERIVKPEVNAFVFGG